MKKIERTHRIVDKKSKDQPTIPKKKQNNQGFGELLDIEIRKLNPIYPGGK